MRGWDEIKRWRKAERARLVALREAMDAGAYRAASAAIRAALAAGFAWPSGTVVAFCWPFKREFDVRFLLRDWRAQGVRAALPVVVGAGRPLEFRAWWPGAPLARGVYDIPYPVDTPRVVPDVAVVPMNGFDAGGCRLGYGGGYFDRTLAALAPRPLAIGVAFECARLADIHPQAHDIAMDYVVTEAGIHAAGADGLAPLTAAACRARVDRWLAERRAAAAPGCYSSPPCYAGEFPGYFGETGD